MGRLVVVVPLREDAHRDALALLRQGPPVDLEAHGVQGYWAFVTSGEAVLVLEGPGIGRSDGGSPWQDLSAWRDGARWQQCAHGRPRLAESIHSWERPRDLEGVSFGPLPGPGDSDGGDNLPDFT
jgi:hypothetical protein